MFSVCLQQRYGFELIWIAGRACDINRNSKKLPGKKQMFYNMLGYQSWFNQWPQSVRFLAANYPERCCFKNILDFVKNKDAAVKDMKLAPWMTLNKAFFLPRPLFYPGFVSLALWQPAKSKVSQVPCSVHKKNCPRAPAIPEGYDESACDGTPCVLFSTTLAFRYGNILFFGKIV